MEKFGMSFGGGQSKKELLETIESQKKQLIQYQTRFRDIVQAYKSLLKEKEALEASLKVLTASAQCPAASEHAEDRGSLHSEDSLDATEAGAVSAVTSSSSQSEAADQDQDQVSHGDAGSTILQAESELEEGNISSSTATVEQTVASTSSESDRRVNQLKSQLSTLTISLATVTQEKSRMEASFQADKRKMKQELEEAWEKVEEERKQHQFELQAVQEQLTESRARVIMQQHQHDQEQHDHGHMLRELQKLLQEERSLRQDAELKLEDARKTFAEIMQGKEQGLDCEERLKQVTQECETLRMSLQALEAERSKPEQRVLELQQEIADLKAHFNQHLQQEIQKVAEAEACLQEQAQLEEQRVASLEERVSELSGLLGACEKARQKDQQNAQRLREHILQLDAENKALAMTASTTRTTSSDLGIDEMNLDVNTLKDKLEKVKKLLQIVAQRSPEQSLEIKKIMEGVGGQDVENASVQYYQQELRQLKEEFERYKVRAQVVLKNKNGKDSAQTKELEEARDQLAELKEKYINLRVQSDEAKIIHKQEIKEHQQTLTALKQAHKQDLEKQEAQHRENFLHLEEELHKQRERTMALLKEKDLELEKLRTESIQGQIVSEGAAERGNKGDLGDFQSGSSVHEECEMIAHTLKLASPQKNNLLLYAEQLARNEVEISTLRKQKHQLEEGLHQLQGKLFANEEKHKEEADELRAQLDKRIRDQSRDGANLEYLKNVIYKFLTLQDSKGRQQTLVAILTILHFSPQERQTVMKQQVNSWWTPRSR